MKRTLLAAAAVALLASACGSTAQTRSTVTTGLEPGSGSGLTDAGMPTLPGDGGTGSTGVVGTTGGSVVGTSGGSGSGGAAGAMLPGTGSAATGATSLPSQAVSSNGAISIGIVLTSTASAAQYGFSSGESYSEKQVDQGLVDALNKQGGLAGHKIDPVYASTDPNGSNWGEEFAAACATFTQDHHVNAVLGYQFNYDQGFETCLTKKAVPHFTTGFNIPDAQELAKHPLHRSLAVPTIDHRSLAKLTGALQDGWLTTKSLLGVVLDTCPGTLSSWSRVAQPFLKSHGIRYMTFESSCSTGNNASAADQVNGVPAALLKFRQAGVDVATFLTVSEGPALVVVGNAAEAQGWRPLYITSSLANLSTLESQGAAMPQGQLANVKSYGWMPAQDLNPRLQPRKSAGQLRCLDLLKSVDVRPASFGDFTNAYRICDAVFAYEAALRVSGTIAGSRIVSALDGLGTSFSNPDVLDGATSFGKGRENVAPAHMRAVIWNGSCSCFNYHGATRPLP